MKARLIAILLAAAVVIPACGNPEPRGSTTFVPGGETTVKAAALSGRQEVPPVATLAAGDATVTISPDLMSVTVAVNFTGLVNPTEAHLHVGEIGVDGPIILPLASGAFGSPLVVTLSAAQLTPQPAQGITTLSEAITAILEGRTYVNLHTTSFPGGEIRGQIGPVTLFAQLDGLQETPPVLTPSSGSMRLAFNNDQSTMSFTLDVPGVPNITAVHIHVAPPGVAGPIVFPLAAGVPPPTLGGTLTVADFTPAAGTATFAEAVDAILSGQAYANVHTGIHPEGEIRGQILGFVVLPPPTTTLPPPSTDIPTTIGPPIIIGPYGARR